MPWYRPLLPLPAHPPFDDHLKTPELDAEAMVGNGAYFRLPLVVRLYIQNRYHMAASTLLSNSMSMFVVILL